MTPVELYTRRLRICTPVVGDAGLIANYLTENWTFLEPWMPRRPAIYFTPEHWERYILRRREEESELPLLVRCQESDAVLGMAVFSSINRGPALMCNLGYNLAEKAQGHGYLTEALPAAIDYVFTTLELHRVQANYMPRNERSGRLLRRLGFVVEGYARDYLQINGRWEDHILTSKTAPESK
ncbi:MAG: GNAT family N-acetyltransferase [Armatimonas sp.]